MKTLCTCLLLIVTMSAVPAAPKKPVVAAPFPSATAAPAQDVTAVTVPDTLLAMLVDYQRYADTLWHADTAHAGEGYWGSGAGNGGNEGVRAISTTALSYALLARQGDTAFTTAARVGPALRYAADIHVTGSHAGTDSQTWGNSWQSAMWAGNLGVAAWLAKDTLAPDALASVKRVVAYEADRFTGVAPPTMLTGDTKAEENSWT